MEVLGWRSDAELVDGVRRGEDFAFGRLFERWFGRVLGIAQDILGDPQAAAEVATDTFHALWHHLDRLDDPEGFGAWAVETSRTFAYERLTSPENREKTAPIPTLATAPDAAAAVAVALVARGLPSAAGLSQSLQAASAAIVNPFGPATAGAAGSAPAPAGFAGAVPSVPAPAGFAGATVPASPQAPPAGFAGSAPGSGFAGSAPGSGFAGSAPGSGFAGTPGSGSILGGAAGQVADMATQAMPSLGAFDPVDDGGMPRVHRYELPPGGGLLRSPQALAGIAAAVILVVVGALLLLTRDDDSSTAASEITTTPPPAAPSISEPTSTPASTSATTATTATTAPESSTADTTEASTTSTTRRATTTSTTRATTTSRATSASTTGTTTATTPATTPTTGATTSSSQATTSSSSVTRTTPTSDTTSSSSSSSSSSSTVPKPVITTFTVVANPEGSCVGAAAKLNPYTATWSATNARTSSLAVNGATFDGAGKGTKEICAQSGTKVTLTVTGPGGEASLVRTTR